MSTPFGYTEAVNLSIELDREDDGRWIAEVLEIPGVMAYGVTREEAISNTERLAIRVLAGQAAIRFAVRVGPDGGQASARLFERSTLRRTD